MNIYQKTSTNTAPERRKLKCEVDKLWTNQERADNARIAEVQLFYYVLRFLEN